MAQKKKDSFLRAGEQQNLLILKLQRLAWRLIAPLPDSLYIKIKYLSIKRKWPNIKNPKNFTEKIQYRKIHDRNPLYVKLADKIEVKNYIKQRVGADFAIPTLWAGTRLEDINWNDIPLPAVIKPNHTSGLGHFLHGNSDIEHLMRCDPVTDWLAIDHARYNREWAYSDIPRQAMIEPLLMRDGGVPWDYRCFVFHGKVVLVSVDVREDNHGYCANFSVDWSRLPFHDPHYFPPYKGDIPAPTALSTMVELAETVAGDLDFVRVDFYDTGDHLYIGELTLYPGGGFEAFEPKEFDRWLGNHWTIRSTPAG
ncbi:ATP-grasp fold amidoligase family protein [Pannonibacter carbonis]|uniref:ATP-grasp fold amidoligase family protein n=1 Tax=Pannonibacter carbonis TaxID=2067569 RepID=UPI000D0EABE8|nr:ATP-grasp fold amidoligase family protein [Pannonibacter carbonis]